MNRLVHVLRFAFPALLALAVSVSPFVPSAAAAGPAQWTVTVGDESTDQGIQLAYFFPGDITINQGDTITFIYNTGEPHSVHFDNAGTDNSLPPAPPPPPIGLHVKGDAPLTWTFSEAGDFAYHCDLHTYMTGMLHVKPAGSAYPFTQTAYDKQSMVRQNQLMAEGLATQAQGFAGAAQAPGVNNVTVGIGVRDGPGSIFVLRFLKDSLKVKVGDTVTWTNLDYEAPHTITMNLEYPNPFLAVLPYGLDAAGHATAKSTTDQINSGFLWSSTPPGFPNLGAKFQIKFTQPGTYNYHCELHDSLGMTGTIQVTPN